MRMDKKPISRRKSMRDPPGRSLHTDGSVSSGAVGNVSLPSLVRHYFPDRIARMSALYATGVAMGTTLGAGFTVPVGDLGDGWRLGLGSWAVPGGWSPCSRRLHPRDGKRQR
jgi:MFS transporter, CP family, cyanate transporter